MQNSVIPFAGTRTGGRRPLHAEDCGRYRDREGGCRGLCESDGTVTERFSSGSATNIGVECCGSTSGTVPCVSDDSGASTEPHLVERMPFSSKNERNSFTGSVPDWTQQPSCAEMKRLSREAEARTRDGNDRHVRSSHGLKGTSRLESSMVLFASRGNTANENGMPFSSARPNSVASHADRGTGRNAGEHGKDITNNGEREEEEASAARREMMEQMLQVEEGDTGMAVGEERAKLLHRLLIAPQLEFFKIQVGAAPLPRWSSEAALRESSLRGKEPTKHGRDPVLDGGVGRGTPLLEETLARRRSSQHGGHGEDDAKDAFVAEANTARLETEAARRLEKAESNRDRQEHAAVLRATHGVFSRRESSAGPASRATCEQKDRSKEGSAVAVGGSDSVEKGTRREDCGASFGVFKTDHRAETLGSTNEREVRLQVGASTDSQRFLSGVYCDADAVRTLWAKKTRLDSIFDDEMDWLYRAARDFVFPRDGWSKKHLNRAGDKIEEICDALEVHCGLASDEGRPKHVAHFQVEGAPSSVVSRDLGRSLETENDCGATHGTHATTEKATGLQVLSHDLQQKRRVAVLLGCCALPEGTRDGEAELGSGAYREMAKTEEEEAKAKPEGDTRDVCVSADQRRSSEEERSLPFERYGPRAAHATVEEAVTPHHETVETDRKDTAVTSSLDPSGEGVEPREKVLEAFKTADECLSTSDLCGLASGSSLSEGSCDFAEECRLSMLHQGVPCSIRGGEERVEKRVYPSEKGDSLRVFVDICGGPGAWSLFLLRPTKDQSEAVLRGEGGASRPVSLGLSAPVGENRETREERMGERAGKGVLDHDGLRSDAARDAVAAEATRGVKQTKAVAAERTGGPRVSQTAQSVSESTSVPSVCGFGMTLATGAAEAEGRKARTLWYPQLASNPRWTALWGADGTGNVYRAKNLAHGKEAISRWVAEAEKTVHKDTVAAFASGRVGSVGSVKPSRGSEPETAESAEPHAVSLVEAAVSGRVGLQSECETHAGSEHVPERSAFALSDVTKNGKESEQAGSQAWSQRSLSTSASSDAFHDGSLGNASNRPPGAGVSLSSRPEKVGFQAITGTGADLKETPTVDGDKTGEGREGEREEHGTEDKEAARYQGVSHVCLVVADGGFHLGLRARTTPIDAKTGRHIENYQELLCARLLLSELLFALMLLEEGGNFVCKIFDTFTHFTASLVYIVGRLFEDCAILKPIRSRAANSERYLVGLRLKDRSSVEFQRLFDVVRSVHGMWEREGESGDKLTEDESPEALLPVEFLTSDEVFVKSLRHACRFLCKKQSLALDLIYRKYVCLKASPQFSAVLKSNADWGFRVPRLLSSPRVTCRPSPGGPMRRSGPGLRGSRVSQSGNLFVSSAHAASRSRGGAAALQTVQHQSGGGGVGAAPASVLAGTGGGFSASSEGSEAAPWVGKNVRDSRWTNQQRGMPYGISRAERCRGSGETFESWEVVEASGDGAPAARRVAFDEGTTAQASLRCGASLSGTYAREETDRDSRSGTEREATDAVCKYADGASVSSCGAHHRVRPDKGNNRSGSTRGGRCEGAVEEHGGEAFKKTAEEMYAERMQQLQRHHEQRLQYQVSAESSGRGGGHYGPSATQREKRDLPSFSSQGQQERGFAEFQRNSEANLMSPYTKRECLEQTPVTLATRRDLSDSREAEDDDKTGKRFSLPQRFVGQAPASGVPLGALHVGGSRGFPPLRDESAGGLREAVFVESENNVVFASPLPSGASSVPSEFSAPPVGTPELLAHRQNMRLLASYANHPSTSGASSSPSDHSPQNLSATLLAALAPLTNNLRAPQIPVGTRSPALAGGTCVSQDKTEQMCSSSAVQSTPAPMTVARGRRPSLALMKERYTPEGIVGRESGKQSFAQAHASPPFYSPTGVEASGPLLAFQDLSSTHLSRFPPSTFGSAAHPRGVCTAYLASAAQQLSSQPAFGDSRETPPGTLCSSDPSAAVRAVETVSRLAQLSRKALAELVTRDDMQQWIKALRLLQEKSQEQRQQGLAEGVQPSLPGSTVTACRRSAQSEAKEGAQEVASTCTAAGDHEGGQNFGENWMEGCWESNRREQGGGEPVQTGERGGERRVVQGERHDFLGGENFTSGGNGRETRRGTEGSRGQAGARGAGAKRGGNRHTGKGKGKGRRGGLWDMMDDDIMDINTWTM
ncbi:ribosomal RNA large subunit methyltransferase J protein [Toxoplasma gondii GT1]|uniref:Cap-specific mRNA (nucleoside-2'-O-)-methyltransferase 1 n=4 Tax=Toxoplasma gondii TaxID=5811 RepID=S7ULK0_TOXGG|nr:ribosomal RNA large subunit methyltransferase J protein [Toxoplasma gondii GT1]KAF4645578.1 ribosomal RNA large subunit methyltransferase J protein [Toxoplasma gondii]